MARLHNQNMTPGLPAKPPDLGKRAEEEWDRVIQELTQSNVAISKAHRTLIEQAAAIAVDIQDAKLVIEKEGAYIPNTKTGALQAHPAARRMDALRRDYVKLMSTLGMRSVKVPKPKPAFSATEILNG